MQDQASCNRSEHRSRDLFKIVNIFGVTLGKFIAVAGLVLLASCGGGGGSTSGSTSTGGTNISNGYIAALTDGIGLRRFDAILLMGQITTATQAAPGSYSMAIAQKSLVNRSWGTDPLVVSRYMLSATGNWVADTVTPTLTPNADGTLTINDAGLGIVNATQVAVDLSNKPINTGATLTLQSILAIQPASAVVSVGAAPAYGALSSVPATAVYPPGSTAWVWTGITAGQDDYEIQLNSQLKTPAGNMATIINWSTASVFNINNPLCVVYNPSGYNAFQFVYSAVQPSTANTVRFDVYTGGTCTAGLAGGIRQGTVDFVFTTVRGQPIVQLLNETTSGSYKYFSITYPGGWVRTRFIAAPVVNGSVIGMYQGIMTPQGFLLDLYAAQSGKEWSDLNKTAMDAVMNAAGLPTF